MTDDEFAEWGVIFQTRLGSLCGTAEPSEAQTLIAKAEADAAIKALKEQERSQSTHESFDRL